MTSDEAQANLHAAIGDSLGDGEIAIAWTLTIDVAGPDQRRYLAHRAGGGVDGSESPMAWTALGMLRASVRVAEDQVAECTDDSEGDE